MIADNSGMAMHFDVIERATLGDQVHTQLSDMLISGRLGPGDQLSLRTVAGNLGVSVMPVREAVTRLTADGALEVLPNRAIRVPPMSTERFQDLARIRTNVEGFAAAEAARLRTSAQANAIERTEAHFRREVDRPKPDPTKVISLNKDFHFAIYLAAGSPILLEIIRRLWLIAGPILNLDFRESPERLAGGGVLERHGRALAAVLRHDSEEARQAVVDDIQSAADFILAKPQKQVEQ